MATRSLRDRLADGLDVDSDDLALEAPDAWCVLAGMLTLHIGAEMAYAREPSVIWGVVSMYVFASALVLVGAGLANVDVRRWGGPLATVAFTALLSAVGITYLMIQGSPINTDALGFINTAAEAVLAGQSPYPVSMHSAGEFPTPAIGGGYINRYSYPVGSALAAAPFVAVVEDGSRVAVLIATAIAGGLLLAHAPSEQAPMALFSMLVGDFIVWGVNGLTDPLWVAPLLGALFWWPYGERGRDSLLGSGALFGLAMAMKQQPWFCAPFLFLWAWRTDGLRTAVRYATAAAAVFVTLHLPVFVLSPRATVTGLFVNLIGGEGTLVHLGVGLSALTLSGAYPVAKWAHSLLMVSVGLGGLAVYWLRFETVKWLAWIAWAPVLFVSYRSLGNYFVVVAPVAAGVLIASETGLLGGDEDVA